ncbi:MAG: hypothetical protein IT162_04710 [Bryobacterales bacterium]|nr:hypothetical protein [Bryobacterales bacterium]
MGLDIRKPIGLLFAVIAAELLAYEACKLAGIATGGGSIINTWCALAFAAFGAGMLWLSR